MSKQIVVQVTLDSMLDACTADELLEVLANVLERVPPDDVEKLVQEYRTMLQVVVDQYWEDYARGDL